MKKKWYVEVSQNGWEYTGWVTFYAEKVERKSKKILLVDGFEMEFDEEVKDAMKPIRLTFGRETSINNLTTNYLER